MLAAALLLPCCTCLVSAATVVSEYQYNPTADWFTDPPAGSSNLTSHLDLTQHTSNASHAITGANMYNYATTAPITDALLGISGIQGAGLNLMVQNRNAPLNAGASTGRGSLSIRSNVGRLNFRTDGSNGGGGSSVLAWSTSANTSLNGLTYALSIGPSTNSGEGNPSWEEGMRLAIQDTSDNWFLSNWVSNGKIPEGGSAPASGTEPGLHLIGLTSETWAPFAPATSASTSLVVFDAVSATFSPFAGEAKAFGFYLQDDALEGAGGTTAIRTRMNGFQVTVPEPSSALLLGLGGIFLARRRRR
jgi:hypothetical protein